MKGQISLLLYVLVMLTIAMTLLDFTLVGGGGDPWLVQTPKDPGHKDQERIEPSTPHVNQNLGSSCARDSPYGPPDLQTCTSTPSPSPSPGIHVRAACSPAHGHPPTESRVLTESREDLRTTDPSSGAVSVSEDDGTDDVHPVFSVTSDEVLSTTDATRDKADTRDEADNRNQADTGNEADAVSPETGGKEAAEEAGALKELGRVCHDDLAWWTLPPLLFWVCVYLTLSVLSFVGRLLKGSFRVLDTVLTSRPRRTNGDDDEDRREDRDDGSWGDPVGEDCDPADDDDGDDDDDDDDDDCVEGVVLGVVRAGLCLVAAVAMVPSSPGVCLTLVAIGIVILVVGGIELDLL